MANIGGLPNNFVNETTVALKKRKREENLKNWKWEDVIVIDDVDVPNEVAETDDNDVENDDDVPPAPIKRSKKHHIKISARNRLYRVFDSEEDEDEAENKNLWPFDDEVADEDEYDDEVDDEDEWP
ncbi:hypothetical protein Tco_0480535 [Tanacetum coccineum]